MSTFLKEKEDREMKKELKKLNPPIRYTEGELKKLYSALNPGSFLATFLKTSGYNNTELFRLLIAESLQKKQSEHVKNLTRSLRCILYDVSIGELPLWVNEPNLEIRAIVIWRLKDVC